MVKAQVNEVWKMRSGRLGLIVDNLTDKGNGNPSFLWFDEVSQTWTVSMAWPTRLLEKTDLTSAEFFGMMAREVSRC